MYSSYCGEFNSKNTNSSMKKSFFFLLIVVAPLLIPNKNAIAQSKTFTVPGGWSIIQSATYAKLMKSISSPGNVYVIAVDITNNNGSVIPLYDPPNPPFASSTKPSPGFPVGDINFWWQKDKSAFAVTNCSFFALTTAFSAEVSHVLQQSWDLRSTGRKYGAEEGQRWICFNDGYATIGDGPNVPITTNYYVSAKSYYGGIGPTIIGGLHPIDIGADRNDAIGRTMIGIKDWDGDGRKESVYILTAEKLTQAEAYNFLRYTFQCDQTIMLDGSGSTQMICKGNEYVVSSDKGDPIHLSRRKFPVALRIRSK